MATLHSYGPWELIEVTKPSMFTEPAWAHIKEVKETWQRRRCTKCGGYEDKLLREGPAGTPVKYDKED